MFTLIAGPCAMESEEICMQTATEIKRITDTELKNLAINCYSCLKDNGKKINYMTYLNQMKNEECNCAIKRLFGNINLEEIEKMIDSIECISEVRKDFYKKILGYRYEILKTIYEKIK